MKECSRCREEKPVTQFSKDRKKKDGLFAWCKPCEADNARRRTYGLTPAEYQAMRDRQNGCAICQCTVSPLVVDHCHGAGRVRELLCDRCNVGLGKFRDSPDLLLRAADYIRKHDLLLLDIPPTP
jgi:hypothetical protein